MSIVFATVIAPQTGPTVDTWRSKWPADELARRGYDAYYLGPEGERGTTGWARDDVVVIHATNHDVGLSGTVRYLREIGTRAVIVSFDDDYRALPLIQDVRPRHHEPSPEAGDLGHMSWFAQLKADIAIGVRESDGLIASTPAVAEAYRRWSATGQVWTLRNAPPRWITERRTRRLDPPVAGWFGTLAAHRRDIEWLGAAARDIERFGVVGAPDDVERVTGATLVHRKGMVPYRLLPGELGRFSVGIVPVVRDAFNDAKSWIKPLEFAAAGCPVVACHLPEYDEAAARGLPIEFVDTPGEMAERANYLLALSRRKGSFEWLRDDVRDKFCIESTIGDEWEKFAIQVTS